MAALKTIKKDLCGEVRTMCEYCHYIDGHHPRCPNAPEPKVRGYCEQCGEELREDYEYYTDNDNNKFCSQDCAVEYCGIHRKEWDVEYSS